jgi:hypothetical protein
VRSPFCEVAVLFGTLVAETILASVHVRAPKKAGHMGASDLIKALQNTFARSGSSTYGKSAVGEGLANWRDRLCAIQVRRSAAVPFAADKLRNVLVPVGFLDHKIHGFGLGAFRLGFQWRDVCRGFALPSLWCFPGL